MDQGPRLPHHRPAVVRGGGPAGRRLHHLQHLLDPRRPAHAGVGLLRAIGASRRHLITSVLTEALLVGIVASAAGIVLGLGAAHGLLALMRIIGFELPSAPVVFRGRTAAMGLVAGVVVTVAAAIIPARRASAVSPMAAIRAGGGGRGRWPGRRVGTGATVTLLGLATLMVGLYGRLRRPAAGHRTGVHRHPRRRGHAHPAHRPARGPYPRACPWSASSASRRRWAGRTRCATPVAPPPPPPPS